MQMEMVSALLLPVGIWLILSAGTPSQLHRALAAASLIAVAIATLAFIACGFAFMSGGTGSAAPQVESPAFSPATPALSLGEGTQRWTFLGLNGFFLNGVTNASGLSLLMRSLPLVWACVLLVAGALAPRARTLTHALFAAIVAGFVFPVAGCWLWSGWLSALGVNANLGRGVIDLGHLSALGLVAGATSVVWLVNTPRRKVAAGDPELPTAHFPIRAVAGVLCVLGSTTALAGQVLSDMPALPMAQFVNSSIAVSAAILTAGAYAIFTTRKTDVLSASRAALAGVFIVSSGGALLPVWVITLLGIVGGLLATVGYYAVNEALRWQDDSAILTTAFIPSAIGVMATGVFADGAFGIAGLFPQSAPPDPGQLAAQFTGLIAVTLFAFGMSSTTVVLAQRLRITLLVTPEVIYSQSLAQPRMPASVAIATPEISTSLPEVNVTYTAAPETVSADTTRLSTDEATPVEVEATPATVKGKKGWLAWLQRTPPHQSTPKQPRKVAYPYRVGGRRLTSRPPASLSDARAEEDRGENSPLSAPPSSDSSM